MTAVVEHKDESSHKEIMVNNKKQAENEENGIESTTETNTCNIDGENAASESLNSADPPSSSSQQEQGHQDQQQQQRPSIDVSFEFEKSIF
jgi:hypothetical protein